MGVGVKVDKAEFEAVIKALLSAPPMPALLTPRSSSLTQNITVITRAREGDDLGTLDSDVPVLDVRVIHHSINV
jgi:hypothetical protein